MDKQAICEDYCIDDIVVADIKNVMCEIAEEINSFNDEILCDGEMEEYLCNGPTSYLQQRAMLERIFKNTSKQYDYTSVKLRLTVLDSLYSTNANYTYFSIDDMAYEICKLGTEQDAIDYFNGIALGGKDTKGLFSKKYGMHKNCTPGNRQQSLMSKYAYYQLHIQNVNAYPLGFPIYDSLVLKIYPKVCNILGMKKCIKLTLIENYVSALNGVRQKIFNSQLPQYGLQQYDLLDAYLWRMGKIDGGNFSLLFNKCDYERFINNLGLKDRKITDAIVKGKCETMSVNEIMKDISNNLMRSLLEHWKKYYK